MISLFVMFYGNYYFNLSNVILHCIIKLLMMKLVQINKARFGCAKHFIDERFQSKFLQIQMSLPQLKTPQEHWLSCAMSLPKIMSASHIFVPITQIIKRVVLESIGWKSPTKLMITSILKPPSWNCNNLELISMNLIQLLFLGFLKNYLMLI